MTETILFFSASWHKTNETHCVFAETIYLFQFQQEGASEDDINNLSKFKFWTMSDADKLAAGIAAPVGGVMTECGTNPPVEHILSAEDAVSFSSLFWEVLVTSLCYHSPSVDIYGWRWMC